MDFEFINNTKGDKYEGLIYNYVPSMAPAMHRFNKLFFKSCSEQISVFESCFGNAWRSNTSQYMSDQIRRECYTQWNQVRSCAKKNVSDTFSLKLELHRKLPDNDNSDENMLRNYIELTNKKIDIIKSNMPAEEAEE